MPEPYHSFAGQDPPFEIERAEAVDESLRLKYRYLHLRSREPQDAIALRHG